MSDPLVTSALPIPTDAASRANACLDADIWFCGDTHGRFEHLRRALDRHCPRAVIFLGDVQPTRPIEQELNWLLERAEVWFIHGNHDTDSEEGYDWLQGSVLSNRNLHGRVVEVQGLRIAGLGGIFQGQVWMPPQPPRYESAEDFCRQCGNGNLWRGGLPLRHRSTIFGDDWLRLAEQSADVLVTHEAPDVHPYGFAAVTELAQFMNVKRSFHGHQHDSLDYSGEFERLGFRAYGVGLRGICDLNGRVVVAGEQDAERRSRLSAF